MDKVTYTTGYILLCKAPAEVGAGWCAEVYREHERSPMYVRGLHGTVYGAIDNALAMMAGEYLRPSYVRIDGKEWDKDLTQYAKDKAFFYGILDDPEPCSAEDRGLRSNDRWYRAPQEA